MQPALNDLALLLGRRAERQRSLEDDDRNLREPTSLSARSCQRVQRVEARLQEHLSQCAGDALLQLRVPPRQRRP
eukprot:5206437-Prymnesium_polylepis.1